ncbi:MAG: PorV/PorQ family protein [Candidatus Kapaibacterium sp.]
MKRIAVVLSFVASIFPFVHAQTTSPYQFLRVNTSTRAAALAEATVASVEDTSYNVLNPASGSFAPSGRIAATFIKHVADISGGLVSYTTETSRGAKLTFLASYMSLGSFEGRDSYGNPTGQTLTAGAVSLNALYAQEIDSGFHVGAGLNLVSSQYPDSRTVAIALSGGIHYHLPNSRWNAALSVLNLGTQVSRVGSTAEPLPTDVRLGFTHRLRGLPLLFNVSFHHLAERNVALFDGFRNFSIGGEFYLGKVLQLRIGYNNTLRAASSFPVSARFAGVCAGVGIITKKVTVDYAMTNMMSGIMVHRVGINLSADSF